MIILFDGICNLCTGTVQFIVKRDRSRAFLFASLQSAAGREMLKQYDREDEGVTSFLLLEHGILYTRSTAALRVARNLSGGWKLLYAFIIIPKSVRDALYDWIARNRYHWFGRKEVCWVPSREMQERFM
ncbi:MAG: thiol-disulfide oxidoreductase DCC family protein [Ignavibacteriae bacterium]|nr:thiol-disulfide oxidoreductase DCC family protein [Ignavibacteriota bacterium]